MRGENCDPGRRRLPLNHTERRYDGESLVDGCDVTGRDGNNDALPTHNIMSGEVSGPVVQAGAIHEIHFHEGSDGYARDIPAQLPHIPRSFVGRAAQLEELTRWRQDAGRQSPLLVLTGTSGVGKTTLASQWLHEVCADFPDGQLFVDLGRSASEPVVPSEALEWFLLALGVAAKQIPTEPSQREAMYRTATARRRLVVVLDDAVSAAQVRPLIPAGEQCMTVVTSRFRLSGLRTCLRSWSAWLVDLGVGVGQGVAGGA